MEFWNQIVETLTPLGTAGSVVLVLLALSQLVGQIIEWCGKTSPVFLKVFKWLWEKHKEKVDKRAAADQIVADVKVLLENVNQHYSEDNITKRDGWMQSVNTDLTWMHERAVVYDASIELLTAEMNNMSATLVAASEQLERLRKQNEEDHAQRIRNKIIEFAGKIVRPDYQATKDEFNYIFRIYNEYEEYITTHHITNDQINTCIEIIRDEYTDYLRHNRFLEARRSLS